MGYQNPRLSTRRLAQQPSLSGDDLSLDYAHTQAKLAAKKAAIRALEAKVRRLEAVLKAGGTWADYQAVEAQRTGARQAHRPPAART